MRGFPLCRAAVGVCTALWAVSGEGVCGMALCRSRMIFTGTVQGVGFRFTTCRVARRFDVTGAVRNLPDGTVEVVAEGAPGELEAFRDAILSAMGAYVRSHRQQRLTATGEFSDFSVAF